MALYWTDDHLNRWDEVDGVTTYSPPGGPPSGDATAVAFACGDGANGLIAFGVTERHDGTTDAFGWRTTEALVVTDDFWFPEDGVGEYTFPDGDKTSGYFGTAYEGAGATYDPITGHIYLSGIFRRYTPPFGDEVEHTILVIDPAAPALVDSFVLSSASGFVYEPLGVGGGAEGGGQCVLGRKLYYLAGFSGPTNIVEFDMDTGAVRIAQNCLDSGRSGDLQARPSDPTGLWIIDTTPWDLDQIVYLRRFEVADLPWGTDGTPAVADQSIPMFVDDSAGVVATNVNAFCFSGAGSVIYQASLVPSNNSAFFRQDLVGGTPELVVDLGSLWSHGEAYSMWADEAPVPDIRSTTFPARLRFASPH